MRAATDNANAPCSKRRPSDVAAVRIWALPHRHWFAAFMAIALAVCGHAIADPLLSLTPLEPERVHPSMSVELPDFPAKPGTKRFVIFNNVLPAGRPGKALFLRVPREYAGEDSREPARTWGLNLLVHYPDMTGSGNPKNKGALGVCAGGCPGEMLISIYNEIGSDMFGPEIRFASLEKDLHNPAFVHTRYSEVKSEKFTRVVNEEHGTDPKNVSNALYFIEKRSDGSVQFFARCSYNTKVHLCVAYAASPDVVGVEVQYTFHLEEVDDSERIQSTVLGFVQRLIVGVFDYGTKGP